MEANFSDNPLKDVNNIALTISEEELQEISRLVMLVPEMTNQEAMAFMKEIQEKGIDQIREEMDKKQFLIKCFRAAAYFAKSKSPFSHTYSN